MASNQLSYVYSEVKKALDILRYKVSKDKSVQVQGILAKAFDKYFEDIGYEISFPIVYDWLNDKNPNVCRAVSEGLRIWTNRPYFKSNPKIAIELISQHKYSEREYLRKSVGNSQRDISKKYGELIANELSTWDLSDKKVNHICKLVTKIKQKSKTSNQYAICKANPFLSEHDGHFLHRQIWNRALQKSVNKSLLLMKRKQ